MEFIITKVERSIDGLERLEIDINLSFFSFGRDNFTTVDHEAVRGDLSVELQTLLCGCNSGQHRQTIDARFNVRSRTLNEE